MIMTHWTAYRKSNGLKPGDMLLIKDNHRLVRYEGLAMNGIPDSSYDRNLLRFTQPNPVHPFDLQRKQNYYLATKESSSKGYIDPKDAEGVEGINFLNEHVKKIRRDMKKMGNIPQELWMRMEQEAPHIGVIISKALEDQVNE